jgi:hypothetical protein
VLQLVLPQLWLTLVTHKPPTFSYIQRTGLLHHGSHALLGAQQDPHTGLGHLLPHGLRCRARNTVQPCAAVLEHPP